MTVDGTWRRYRTDRTRVRELERWLGRFASAFDDHDQEDR